MMSTLVRHSHRSYKMLVLNPFASVGLRPANAATRGGCWDGGKGRHWSDERQVD